MEWNVHMMLPESQRHDEQPSFLASIRVHEVLMLRGLHMEPHWDYSQSSCIIGIAHQFLSRSNSRNCSKYVQSNLVPSQLLPNS